MTQCKQQYGGRPLSSLERIFSTDADNGDGHHSTTHHTSWNTELALAVMQYKQRRSLSTIT